MYHKIIRKMLKTTIRLLRVNHYIKNLFVFAPLFFSGMAIYTDLLIQNIFVFFLFSIGASSVYIFNDINDINEDRAHPKKKNRPIPSGLISTRKAWFLFLFLSIVALSGSLILTKDLFYIIALYIILNILYSVILKHYSIIDVSIIATGFVLRVFAGAVVTNSQPSMWIIIMTFLLAFFLGLAKRRDDILLSLNGLNTRKNIDGYNLEFINISMVVMASVVIFSYISYTITDSVQNRLGADYLYLTVLFVIIGILRYFQITLVEKNSGSPTKIMTNDLFSQVNIALWLTSFGFIIY
jgi:decaprenyl-phosphate phosphoribosyltransferase